MMKKLIILPYQEHEVYLEHVKRLPPLSIGANSTRSFNLFFVIRIIHILTTLSFVVSYGVKACANPVIRQNQSYCTSNARQQAFLLIYAVNTVIVHLDVHTSG